MAAPTTTRKALRQAIIKRLYSGRYPLVFTPNNTSTTVNIANSTLAPAGQSEDFVRAWVRISATGSGDPAVGEVSRVTNTEFSGSSSYIIVAPAFSAAPDSGSAEAELHYLFHPTVVEDRIDMIMENLKRPILVPLSLITDGDIAASGFSATNASLADEATVGLWGRNSLRVTATSDGGYGATNPAISLPPNTEVLVAAIVNGAGAATYGSTVTFRDNTNSADIGTLKTSYGGWTQLQNTFTLPSTCESVSLRLGIDVSGTLGYYNTAIILPVNHKLFEYPTALEYHEDLSAVYELPPGTDITVGTSIHAYRADENTLIPVPGVRFIRDDTALDHYKIVLPDNYTIRNPLFVKGRVDFALLSNDTTTTTAPKDIVTDLVYASLLDDMAQLYEEDGDQARALLATTRAGAVRRKLLPRMIEFSPQSGKVIGANRVA